MRDIGRVNSQRLVNGIGRWAVKCAASATSDGENDLLTGKMRVRSILLDELPRLFEFSLSPGEMCRGDIFAHDVKYSFPIWWPSGGRMALRALLMSLPMQASMSAIRPSVESVFVDSPSKTELIARYCIRWNAHKWDDDDDDEHGDDTKTSTPSGGVDLVESRSPGDERRSKNDARSRSCLLHVRSRFRLDSSGKIAEWQDTWDRSFSTLVDDLATLSSHANNLADIQRSDLTVTNKSPGDSSQELSANEKRTSTDKQGLMAPEVQDEITRVDSLLKQEAIRKEKQEILRDVMRNVSRGTAESFTRLSPGVLQERAQAIMKFLSDDIPRFRSRKFPDFDYSTVNIFAAIEMEGIEAQGRGALQLFRKFFASKYLLTYSSIDIWCLSVKQQSPRVVVGKYLCRGRSRWGGFSQGVLRCKLTLDGRGNIRHIQIHKMPANDPFFQVFSRMKRSVWVW